MTDLPDWLTGVWRRLSIETEDGAKDTTTQVFWLQTHQCFADIRIPADRPHFTSTSLSELSSEEAIALSSQQGFAGITTLAGDTCQWHRYIDYQPFTGDRDIGTLHWEGELLIELGVDAVYREEWQRLDNSSEDFTALILPSSNTTSSDQIPSWSGCVVTAGEYFMYVKNRHVPLPSADLLTTLLTTTPHLQTNHLDCEISFGVCQSGKVPWEIRLSTLPWREGRSLWSLSDLAIDLDGQQVIQTVSTAQGNETYHWQIQEWGTGFNH